MSYEHDMPEPDLTLIRELKEELDIAVTEQLGKHSASLRNLLSRNQIAWRFRNGEN